MTAQELKDLATWLEEQGRDKVNSAARTTSALAKLQQAAEQQPGWGWRCFLEPGKVRLEYGFWSHAGYETALAAIEGAGK